MTGGLAIRSYLNGIQIENPATLTLQLLIRILCTHFLMQDASTVLTEMQNSMQTDDEMENQFCVRMMKMRQDVMILSRQEGLRYEEELVQDCFQHAVYTGLRNNHVRQQLKYLLKGSQVPDADLLQETADISMMEKERLDKMKRLAEIG